MGVNSYRGLRVWQTGLEIAKKAYVLTRAFPKHEIYGLVSQLQRAAISVPANIAEGHARDSTKEYIRHVSIAQGSLAELETHLILSKELGYCDETQIGPLLEQTDQEGKMLCALRRSLKTKASRRDPSSSP